MRISSFDLAMCSGWALGDVDARPDYGHFKMTPCEGDYGALLLEFETFITPIILDSEAIGYESPIVLDKGNLHTKMITAGLATHLEYLCKIHKKFYIAFMPQVMKKLLAGHGFATKKAMMKRADELGYETKVHDEADALAVWFCMVAKFDKAYNTTHLTHHLDPLFGGVTTNAGAVGVG